MLLACDPGVKNLGWTLGEEEYFLKGLGFRAQADVFTCTTTEEQFNRKMDEENFQCLEFFERLFLVYNITHVAWELPPAFGGMGQQTRILSNIVVLKTLAWQNKCFFSSFTPIKMKSVLTGNSKASKTEIRDEVIKRLPEWDDSDRPKKERYAPDLFDAIGIAMVAIELNDWRRFSVSFK